MSEAKRTAEAETYTVLVVEDNPIASKLVRVTLEKAGYRVLEAPSGQAALERMSQHPDIVLQDIVLPDMDGFELVRRLRVLPGCAGVPIIAFSGFLSKMEQGRSQQVGFTDYLSKPAEPARIVDTVATFLPPSGARRLVGGGRRVLLVDDDPVQLHLTKARLSLLGFQVATAESGADALKEARNRKPEVIVSDVMMPEMDGFRLCLAIRNDPGLADVPVVLYSSLYVEDEDRRLARSLGAHTLVARAPELDDLVVAIVSGSGTKPPKVEIPSITEADDYLRRTLRQLDHQTTTSVTLARRLAAREAELAILSGLCGGLKRGATMTEVAEELLGRVLSSAGVSRGAIYLVGPAGTLAPQARVGLSDPDLVGLADFLGREDALSRVIEQQEPIIVPSWHVLKEGAEQADEGEVVSFLLAPLVAGADYLGVLAMASSSRTLKDDWLPFARGLGTQIGQALALVGALAHAAELEQHFRLTLEHNERRFRALVENASDGIVLIGPSRSIVYASPAVSRMLGYLPEEIVGRKTSTFHHPDDAECIEGLRSQLLQAPGRHASAEIRVRHKDGSWRWMEAVSTNLLEDPGVQAIVSNLRDVTERKQAHETILRRGADFEAMHNIAKGLREARSLEGMYRNLVERTMTIFGATHGALALLNPDRTTLTRVHTKGIATEVSGSTFPVAATRSGAVISTNVPFITGDFSTEVLPEWMDPAPYRALGAFALVPVHSEQESLGTLVMARPRVSESQPFTDNEVRLLETIADAGGTAIRRAQLYADAERRAGQLQALREIDLAIAGAHDLRVSLNTVLGQTLTRLGVDAACVLLFDSHSQMLQCAADQGFRTTVVRGISIALGEGLAGRAALERRRLGIGDLEAAPDALVIFKSPQGYLEGFKTTYVVPLIAKGELVGVFQVFSRHLMTPDDEWLVFLETLAGQTAIAIAGARQFEALQRSNSELTLAYDTTLAGWARALEMRDKETEGHTQRVAALTVRLANQLSVPENEFVHIRRGALLHDIGKMAVSDMILLKPGPLSPDERAAMERHPVYARDLLTPIPYLRPALDIPYCHHEKWDGTGYPRGLKGDEIPLAARIFSVVDVWDALTSDRPYHSAWSATQARAYIEAQSRQHFDPAVIQAFMRLHLE